MKLWTSERPSDAAEYQQLWDAAQHERYLRRWQAWLTTWTALLILAALAFAVLARALGRL